jgi:hypothetical protein
MSGNSDEGFPKIVSLFVRINPTLKMDFLRMEHDVAFGPAVGRVARPKLRDVEKWDVHERAKSLLDAYDSVRS